MLSDPKYQDAIKRLQTNHWMTGTTEDGFPMFRKDIFAGQIITLRVKDGFWVLSWECKFDGDIEERPVARWETLPEAAEHMTW